MWAVARTGIVLIATAALSACTATGHRAKTAPATVGAQDRLVFDGGSTGRSTPSGIASFNIRNVDAGPIVVSSSSHRRVRLTCPASATLRVRVGDGSRQLTVRQVKGQVLLQTPVRQGGHWYVLARTFGALISREQPQSVGPASRGCAG
jgi:hypothetical protein